MTENSDVRTLEAISKGATCISSLEDILSVKGVPLALGQSHQAIA